MRYLKVSLLASALVAVTVTISACAGSVLPQGIEVVMNLLGLGSPYTVSNSVTNANDQSDPNTIKADVKTKADFKQSDKEGKQSRFVVNTAGSKGKPNLESGSYVVNFTYQIDANTGIGSASGTGRFAFKGKSGGKWCAKFTAEITSYGDKIKGEFDTTGGNGKVGGYAVKNGKIDATISSDSVLHLNLSGDAKPQDRRQKISKSCKALSV